MSANYGNWDATGAAQYAAVVVAQSINKSWANTLTEKSGLLKALLVDRAGVKNFTVKRPKILTSVLVSGPAVPAQGYNDADQFNEMPISRTTGLDQAEYHVVLYSAPLHMSLTEVELLRDGERGDLLEGRRIQMQETFYERLARDLCSQTGSTDKKIQGVYHALSTSNTVGGLSQVQFPRWRSNVTAVGGNLTLTQFETMIQTVRRRGGSASLAVFKEPENETTGQYNVYGAFKWFFRSNLSFNDPRGNQNFGYDSFSYGSTKCVSEQYAPAGTIAVLSPESWGASPGVEPMKLGSTKQMEGRLAYETIMYLWSALACSNPGANGLLSGITGVATG